MSNIEVFVIRSNSNNELVGDRVFLDKKKAKEKANDYNDYEGRDVYVDSIILPFVGRNVVYVDIYHGFDYSYGINGGIYDVCYKSSLYATMESAKTDPKWLEAEKIAQSSPQDYSVGDTKICSKDISGEDWHMGDVMEGKFSAEIKKMRVNRAIAA